MRLGNVQDRRFPLTIYYAFKQSETGRGGTASTGWETMLESLIKAGLTITGTWPARSESSNRMRSLGSNALASSIARNTSVSGLVEAGIARARSGKVQLLARD